VVSRLTFRDKVSVCWQKQLRDNYNHLGVPSVPTLDLSKAVIRKVNRKTAESIILKYEWLGTLPLGCTHYYGIFFGSYCAGVTCVSVGGGGANVYAYKEFGLSSQYEFAYLQRGANVHWSPTGANSKLVSFTCKLLAKDTGAKLIIAYSDTDAGEIGTIYQACNWVYIGRGSSTNQWVSPQGRVYDQKLASNIAKRKGVERFRITKYLLSKGWHEQKSNPKGRYVYILDRTDKMLVALIEKLRRPYPKRISCGIGETDSAGRSNVQTGGASPTIPLFEKDEKQEDKELCEVSHP
jgi:hypothetical protein